MSSQDNKKGVSVMIGYILLIVFAVVMGSIIFVWLKTYSPTEGLSCPDGTSFFVEDMAFNSSTSQLTLTTRNNGRFSIAGFFIHASNNSSNDLPTIDLSSYLNQSSGGIIFGSSVIFGAGENLFSPGDKKTNVFDIPAGLGTIYSIRLIPTRFQDENNRERFVSCGGAFIDQVLSEPVICTPDCSGRICGSNGCGGSCGTCSLGFSCDVLGQCYDPSSCNPNLNVCLNKQCGNWANGTCGSVSCGSCQSGFSCDVSGQCILSCGNGVIDSGETCDDGDAQSGDGCSNTCQIEPGWNCVSNPSPPPATVCTPPGGGAASCINWCLSLGLGYSTSNCPANVGQCNSQGGDAQQGGNGECSGTGAPGSVCCCYPAV